MKIYVTKKRADEENQVVTNYSGKITRHFLQLPVMTQFSFRMAEDVKLNIAAGPYIGVQVGEKYEVLNQIYFY